MTCQNPAGKILGNEARVELDFTTCSDSYPTEQTFRPLGTLSTRTASQAFDTTESITDRKGLTKETYITGTSPTFSYSGEFRRAFINNDVLLDYLDYVNEQVADGKQPGAWLRETKATHTYVYYVVPTEFSEEDPEDALSNFSLSFAPTGSVLPPKRERTPTV